MKLWILFMLVLTAGIFALFGRREVVAAKSANPDFDPLKIDIFDRSNPIFYDQECLAFGIEESLCRYF